MSDIESCIKKAADDFTRTILKALHGLTLTELVHLVQAQGAAVVRRVQRKRIPAARAKPTATAKAPAKPKAKSAMSPKQAAARKVQGQFLGLLRKFKGAERTQIKAIGKKNGVPAAVATMKKKLGR